ncbi:suppressor APC domain-containing protein 2-like [Narcine bancroftii]|uniref:suppressor APC domain-containing protein 2-like n=1 Tax=Narcine bancroftii TaxID=1343680 RepID=UPI00383203F0
MQGTVEELADTGELGESRTWFAPGRVSRWSRPREYALAEEVYHRDPRGMASGGLSRAEEPLRRQRQEPRCPPRTFLFSLRTLYDILAEQSGGGAVELRDIERGWPDESRRRADLPPGLLPCLRRVAEPGGRLTFPRLLAGIRSALEQENDPAAEHRDRALASPLTGSGHREAGSAGNPVSPITSSGNGARGGVQKLGIGRSQSITGSVAQATQRRSSSCRSEPRRHTITSGINYDVLKQMKELERERDALLHGLEMVERAKDWYLNQIHTVKWRQEQARQGLGSEYFSAGSQQNRACLLLAKIQEVNCCLSDLISSSGKVPHAQHPINGFAPAAKVIGFRRHPISILQEQNHLLTKELFLKSERITALEREKASLVKQLMDSRNEGFLESSGGSSTII